jgi:hypothetical protein
VGDFTPWTITANTTPLGGGVNTSPIILNVSSTGNETCPSSNDGFISMNVTGGTAPYSYLWNDGFVLQNRTGLTAGTYIVTVTDALAQTATQTVTIITNNLPPNQLSSVIGNSTICTSNNAMFSVNTVANASQYQWNIPPNAAILTGQGTNSIVVNFNASFVSGNVCVVASNTCGTTSQVCKTVTANTGLPVSPDSVYGANTACPNDTLNYYVNPTANTSEYLWAVPTGGTIISGQQTNSISVVYSSLFISGTVSCSSVNACGLGPITRNLNITRKPVPTTPTTIVGSNYGVCNSTKVYSVTYVSGVLYQWNVPSGATIVSGQGTNVVSINYNGTYVSGPITVYAYTTCGNSPLRSKTIYGKPNKPTTVSGPTTFCVGDTATYNCSSVAGATSYDWTVPTNTVIISGQGTTILKIKRTSAVSNGNVCVKASNSCGASANNCVTINVSAIPASISSIVGTANGICNTLRTFSVTNQSGIVFTWSVPIGCTIQTGQGTYKITVQVGSTFTTGDITVTASSACGIPTTAYKTISGAPTSPSSITGLTQLCSNQISVNYSCTTVAGAMQYNWTIPSGAAYNSGQGTNLINVNFNSSPGTTGSVKVQAVNSCGSSTNRTLSVSFVQCISRSKDRVDDIQLYPNPASNEVTIDLGGIEDQTISVKCMNTLGQVVYENEGVSQDATLKINTASFAEGLYYVTLNNSNFSNKVLKMIISR